MCLCFETIKCVEGKLENLSFHQARFEKTSKELFGNCEPESLQQRIETPKKGVFRIKVIYGKKIEKIEVNEYTNTRVFKKIALAHVDFEYSYKYLDREKIDKKPMGFDEVLFVKEGLLRDTSIANIALLIDGVWKTPKHPLLLGTMRAQLLEKELLIEDNLSINSLKMAQKFAIMNALVGFQILENIEIEELN